MSKLTYFLLQFKYVQFKVNYISKKLLKTNFKALLFLFKDFVSIIYGGVIFILYLFTLIICCSDFKYG